MDYKELVERLRTESLYKDKATLEIMDLCMDAAEAITDLLVENQALRNAANGFKVCAEDAMLTGYAKCLEEMCEEVERLKACTKTAERDRDAAVKDLNALRKQIWEEGEETEKSTC